VSEADVAGETPPPDAAAARRGVRVGLPVIGVLLVAAAVIAMAAYSYSVNRRDALALAEVALDAIDDRVQAETKAFFVPAARILGVAEPLLAEFGSNRDEMMRAEAFGMQVLQAAPLFTIVSAAQPDGSFLMVRRNADGTISTKHISYPGGQRTVTWVHRDAKRRVVSIKDDPADTFDPLSRPWYKGAIDSDRLFWTDVYIFFTDQRPGITASTAFRNDDGSVRLVIGIDILLDDISGFLARLDIGDSGRAMIIDGEGHLIAYPDPSRLTLMKDGALVPTRLDELGEPVLTAVWDRLRLARPRFSFVDVDDKRHVVIASPLSAGVGHDWRLLIVVAEDDLVGFVATNNRQLLIMSIGVVALAGALAVSLVFSGLRADRNARLVADRQTALLSQSRSFSDLAELTARLDPVHPDALRDVTAIVAGTVGARRVSIWHLETDGNTLVCDGCFDQETGGHTARMEIRREECPAFFGHLERDALLDVADAATDARTGDVFGIYLQRVGCRSLLSVPIVHDGKVTGALWIEDATAFGEARTDAVTFARSVANLIGVRFAPPAVDRRSAEAAASPRQTATGTVARGETARAQVAPQSAMRTTSMACERRERFLDRLARQGLDPKSLAATTFPDTSVLVLHFSEQFAMASHAAADGTVSLIDRMAVAIQQIAEEHDVDYVKILGDNIVSVAGFGEPAAQAASVMAEMALAIQDHCTSMVSDIGHELDFTVGIDTGVVLGSAVGFGRGVYNVWGEALRGATIMAASAPRGALQVTESTYRLLADHYVFRTRGAFFLEGIGELSTYLLRGRL
jgi:class 3 adenylate cyclase